MGAAIYCPVRLSDDAPGPAVANVKKAGVADVDDSAIDVQNAGSAFANVKVVGGIESARVQGVITHGTGGVTESYPAAGGSHVHGRTILHIRALRVGTIRAPKVIQRPNRVADIYLDNVI